MNCGCACAAGAGYSGTTCETADACAATSIPVDDGANGDFYCLRGGTATGNAGDCGCACAAGAGYSGTNCEAAGACAATGTPADDGTNGNFYCLNGGTAPGNAGNCGCACAAGAGYSGTDCETADACAATSTPADDGTNGDFCCLNGGTATGNTGNCGWRGAGGGCSGDRCGAG